MYNCLGLEFNGKCTSLDQNAILGMEAEWIMERTDEDLDLADYNVAWMYNAYALQTNGSWMNYNGANNQQIFMYNNNTSHLLSAPFVWNNSTIQYFWYNFH